ncbi:MAG: RHS repeat-associated core domain-containing protein [Nitrospirota bacterium]
MVTIQNGLGGTSTISYLPSTRYQSGGKLPLVIQTVSTITTNDGSCSGGGGGGSGCMGISTTLYAYSGGKYDFAGREFRGFSQVTATDPIGTVTTTRFHQEGIFKGRPYEVQVADSQGRLFTKTLTVWAVTTPFANSSFPELSQVDTLIYDGATSPLTQTRTQTTYDCDLGTPCYGNVVRVANLGEVTSQGQIIGPDYYSHTDYALNTDLWIVGLPSHQYTRGTGDAVTVAESWVYYDGTSSDCSSAIEMTQPTKGNLTLAKHWLNLGGPNPQAITGYDQYGNPICSKDPRGTLTTIQYDQSSTFPLNTTIHDSHAAHTHHTLTTYYGVNSVTADAGLYGQVKSITDANNQTITIQYDTFGRKAQVLNPDGGMTTTAYLNFGAVGTQRIRTAQADGSADGVLWSEQYFDGLGRAYRMVAEGPVPGKTIVQETTYDPRGLIIKKSLPYFSSGETPRYTTMDYDAIGRAVKTTGPDGTITTVSYSGLTMTTIDVNGQPHRQITDAHGRTIQVDEYETGPVTPSATTRYQYDALGNLVKVTDPQGFLITMAYDSLSRKIGMSDPDMGNCGDLTTAPPAAAFPWYSLPCWSYAYDAGGSMTAQRDGRGQTTAFAYDALKRVVTKTLHDGNQVLYAYDNDAATNSIGRLSLVQDPSGSTSFQYNAMGRVTRSTKTVTNDPNATQYPAGYTTQTQYDALGRLISLTYPAPASTTAPVVTYSYNPAGWLDRIAEDTVIYAAYPADQYTALGQPKLIQYGNEVSTTYDYRTDNNRLQQITTATPVSTYQSLAYTFDNGGKVTRIQDPLRGDRSFVYDALSRLSQASYGSTDASSLTNFSYTYDRLGNLTRKSQGTATGQQTTTVDDASPAISYEKRIVNWNIENQSRASGGSFARSNTQGDTASFIFTGTGVQWLAVKSSDSGTAQVYLDGAYQQDVDLKCSSCGGAGSNSALYQQPVWSVSGLANTGHLVEIIVLRSCGQCNVTVDAFVVTAPTASLAEESSPAVTLTAHLDGAWETRSNASASGGAYAATKDTAAVATYQFTGTGFSWLAVKSNEGYQIDVYLDGLYQATVNLKIASGTSVSAVWSRTDLAAGLHLVKFVVTPGQSKNGNLCGSCTGGFTLDALDVLPTPGGSWVRTENSGLAIDYGVINPNQSGWSTINDPSANGGSYHQSSSGSNSGTEATYTFWGYGIAWIAPKNSTGGLAQVYLDGAWQATVDLYSPTSQPQLTVWSRSDLPISAHTLTIVVTGTKNVASAGTNVYLDALRVYYATGVTTTEQACNYTNSAHVHAISACGAETFTYDAVGNLTAHTGGSNGTRSFQWDVQNRLSSATVGGITTSFLYDGDGGRVMKLANGNPTVYIGKLYECNPGGACTRYIFAGEQRIAMQTSASELFYYHTDHLGSSTVITKGSGPNIGALAQAITYDPYGKILTNEVILVNVHHKFTGQLFDDSTGLSFYNARYYDPTLGRFISADTIVPRALDPQALNRYSYVRNNPLNLVDPSGHGWLGDFFHDVFGGVFDWFRKSAHSIADRGRQALDNHLDFLRRSADIIGTVAIVAATIVTGIVCQVCVPVVIGALIGEAFGAVGAAISGGDLFTGVLIGGLAGAVGGYLGGQAFHAVWQGAFLDAPFEAFLAAGIVGGGSGGFVQGMGFTLANGGSWRAAWRAGYQGAAWGAGIGAATSFFGYIYAQVAKTFANPLPGGVLDDTIAIGTKQSGIFQEGGLISKMLNLIPGANAIAGYHDLLTWVKGIGCLTCAMNYVSIPPSIITTYGAIVYMAPAAPLAIDQAENNR